MKSISTHAHHNVALKNHIEIFFGFLVYSWRHILLNWFCGDGHMSDKQVSHLQMNIFYKMCTKHNMESTYKIKVVDKDGFSSVEASYHYLYGFVC